ncbi:hypothetical protein DEMA109039_12605 [Deinococcus marmoris]
MQRGAEGPGRLVVALAQPPQGLIHPLLVARRLNGRDVVLEGSGRRGLIGQAVQVSQPADPGQPGVSQRGGDGSHVHRTARQSQHRRPHGLLRAAQGGGSETEFFQAAARSGGGQGRAEQGFARRLRRAGHRGGRRVFGGCPLRRRWTAAGGHAITSYPPRSCSAISLPSSNSSAGQTPGKTS